MNKSGFLPEFESAVLACLVQDQKFIREALSVLRPEYFVDAMHGSACKVISAAYIKTKQAPSRPGFLSALVEEERRRAKGVKQKDEDALILAPCRALVDRCYEQLGEMADVKERFLDFCKQREMENALLEQYQKIEKGESNAGQVAEVIRRTHQRLTSQSQGGGNFFADVANGALESEIQEMQGKVFTTGFPKLDIKMGGGVSPGTLTTWIAGPKGGKSTIMLNQAFYNMARGKSIVHFTCEISEKKTKKRYASRISEIDYNKIHLQPKLMIDKCAEFWDRTKSSLIVKGYPASTASCDNFRSYLYWLESDQGIKPDLVIIDYGDEVVPIERKGEVRHDLGQVYKEMRVLAEEFQLPVITASQGNRESLSKMVIRMQDIAESIQKCAVSDHILSVCMSEDEKMKGEGRLFFAGSREAETGDTIGIRHDFKTFMMAEALAPGLPRAA